MSEQTIDHSIREHAKHSPSSLESKELCPGFQNNDTGTDSPWASDGEKCHEAVAAELTGVEAPETLNSDLQSFVRDVLGYVQPRIAGCELLISEKRVFHAHPLLLANSHGTPDLFTLTGKRGQLFDFKFGRRPVTHAKDNLQGYCYAIALFDSYPEMQELEIHFVVPRIHDGSSYALLTRSGDYDRILTRVLRTVERAISHRFSDLNPCWSACVYCGKKAKCEALTNFVNRVYELSETPYSDDGLSEIMDSKDPEDRGFIFKAAGVVADWAEQTKENLKQQALQGEEIGGFELRFTKGRTSLKTLDKVTSVVPEIPVDKLLEVATLPLTELKKLYTDGCEPSEKTSKEKELMKRLASAGALKSGDETSYLYRVNEKQ